VVKFLGALIMKIVISTDGEMVSAHFGRCPQFTIIEIENGELKNREIIPNPGHHPGFLPQFFKDKNVECIVAGGMGMNAQNLFNQFNIQQIMGISGTIESVITMLQEGNLIGKESLCKPGGGKGYGVDKTTCDHGGEE
jgi:predicted Fe-Mo cluster-binding NifX family protein